MLINEKNIDLKSDIFFLRNILKQDVFNDWWKWLNDSEITNFMDKGHVTNTIEDQLKYFNKMIESDKDLLFAICLNKNNLHIGNTGLHNIDFVNKSAQFGIMIGNKKYHNLGIGKKAWKLTLSYAFHILKLDKIKTIIVTLNSPSLTIAKKLGFEIISEQKNYYFKNNKAYNGYHLSITKQNWIRLNEK